VRTTEITVSRLNTAATWLRRRKRITRDAALLPPDWRAELLEHWRGVTKATRDPQPSRPRHTLDQLRKLLTSAEEVDPRLGLLLQLGAEYRLGQVVRSHRTDLDLDAGTLFVHGRGRKGGELIALTEGQMAAVRRALGGYLLEDEERFLAKGTDYLLFPSGRLKRWREDVPRLGDGVDRTKPLSRRWIIKNFHLAEDMAGVPRVKGRAAYGLRRQNVDAANAAGISRHGLQASGGWSSTKVADEVYREQENQLGREEARRVRAKTRGEEA
jgi:integrase